MKRFIEGRDRDQATLFPQRLHEAIGADNPVPTSKVSKRMRRKRKPCFVLAINVPSEKLFAKVSD